MLALMLAKLHCWKFFEQIVSGMPDWGQSLYFYSVEAFDCNKLLFIRAFIAKILDNVGYKPILIFCLISGRYLD